MKKDNIIYLSLGSNMGDSLYYLVASTLDINSIPNTKVLRVSPFYKNRPWGGVKQGDFYNIALKIKTKLLPYEILRKFQKIELKYHRERIVKWGPRTIDIDIIFYGDLHLNTSKLQIPHPYFSQRKFVLEPLRVIYPNNFTLNKYFQNDLAKLDSFKPDIYFESQRDQKNRDNKKYNDNLSQEQTTKPLELKRIFQDVVSLIFFDEDFDECFDEGNEVDINKKNLVAIQSKVRSEQLNTNCLYLFYHKNSNELTSLNGGSYE